ncbi:MAG: biliverdin-producing heme oxygenase [Cystobacter sp.]
MSGLPELLRRVTAEEMRAVAGTPFAQRLARGTVDRVGYVRWLSNLQSIYAELEWALMWNRQHPVVGALCLPELWCNELIQDDLRALLGPGWYATARRQDATPTVQRLGLLCDEAPELLAAHAWVLYATELPGEGQTGAAVARALGLRGAAGTVFLRHATRLDGEAYRAHLLDMLDQMSPDERTRESLAHEAVRAVRGLRGLFETMSRGLSAHPGGRDASRSGWLQSLTPLRGAFGA